MRRYFYLLCTLLLLQVSFVSGQTIQVNLGNTTVCAGEQLVIPFTITGTFSSGNVFTAQMSDATGSFASPTNIGTFIGTNSGNIFATVPLALTGSGYRIRIVSNAPTVTSTNTSGVITIQPPAGNPAVFGNGVWRVYGYRNDDFTNYAGFFETGSALNFNSADYYATNNSPSDAAGYAGCNIPINNHSTIFKRTNIPCGEYRINVTRHDDNAQLLINGVQVWSRNGTGSNINNIWTGILGPNSTVEFRLREFSGNTRLDVTFDLIDVPEITLPSSVTKCATAPAVNITATSTIPLNYTWSPATGLNTTTGATVQANPATTTTYIVTGTHPASGCVLTKSVTVNVNNTSSTTISPSSAIICPGQGTILTANGAATYTWSPATGLSATTGNTVTANPATTTTYTVTGDNGCGNLSTATVTVTVGSGAGDPTVFGNGQWNVYAFQGNIKNIPTPNYSPASLAAATNLLYLGTYVEPNLTFDSRNRWNANSNPSNASGYAGCPVPNNQHSLVYKRTNFTCQLYQIDVTNHDDDYELWIDGVRINFHNGCCDAHNNVYTGLLTPTSQVEFRWREGGGASHGGLRFTPLPNTDLITMPNPVICPTTGATLTVNPSMYNPFHTYTWTGPSGFTATGATITTPVGVAGTYTVTATSNGCSVSDNVNVTLSLVPTVTVTPLSATICQGQSVTLTANGASTYSWSPATGLNTTTGNTVIASPTATTTYTVTASDGCNTITADVTITVTTAPTGTSGEWLVECYNDNNFNNYAGYYTEPSLNFDSRSRWGNNNSPSDASGYVGCPVPNNQHSVIYKRTGFPCGYYQLNIPSHDDHVFLFINGVQVFSFLGCCTTHNNVWTGFLGAGSTVEYRWREFNGGSHGALNFVDVSSSLSFTSSPVTICETTSTNLSANLPVSNVTGAPQANFTWSVVAPATQWDGVSGDFELSSTAGGNITATSRSPNSGFIRCTATDPVSGCSISRDIAITVNPIPTTTLTASATTVCRGEPVTLSVTGANSYLWSTGSTATSITVNPTVTTTYTVTGNNNCTTLDDQVTITVIQPGVNDTDFGDGEWLVLAYNGNYIANPATAFLRGHYTEKSISFNSALRWNTNTNPTNAVALPDGSLGYTGCTVNNDNHSLRYKRTNFPCGYYTINLSRNNDDCQLWVDGALVYSRNNAGGAIGNVWSGLLDASSTVEFIWQDNTGASEGSLSIGFALGSASTAVWTGDAGNSDWFNPLNWCPNVPNSTTDAIIPGAGVSFYPVINNTGAECQSLNITSGASLTINGSFSLNVYGNFDNEGTFIPNNSTVNLVSSASNTLDMTGAGSFYNLNVNQPSQSTQMQSPVTVTNQLTLSNGGLDLNGNTLSIDNSSTTAIVQGSGYIRSETNSGFNPSIVCWDMGANTGTFIYPFGVSASELIPVTFVKNTNFNTEICISTRATGIDNTPWDSGVIHVSGVNGSNAIDNVIDRWWNIESSNGNLPAPGANVTLSYRASENTLSSPTALLAIQHYESSINDWEAPYNNASVGVTSGIGSVTGVGLQKFSPHLITTFFQPLPISLLNFDATYQSLSRQVWVTWEEENNIDVERYIVERSTDARNFQAIGEVTPKEALANAYLYIDENPLDGISYYRLRQIKTNARGGYSYSIPISILKNVIKGLQVIPNPTNTENVNIFLQEEKDEPVTLTIYNQLGVEQFSANTVTDKSGLMKLHLDKELAKGVYIVQARTSQKIYQKKFVVK